MRYLRQFLGFDFELFVKDKTLMHVGSKPWIDTETKAVLGTVVETVIVRDNTPYVVKDNSKLSNKFEKLSIKVNKNDLDIPLDAIVKPVNAVAKVWGDYQNQLSVVADDIRIIQTKKE